MELAAPMLWTETLTALAAPREATPVLTALAAPMLCTDCLTAFAAPELKTCDFAMLAILCLPEIGRAHV